MKKLLLLGVVAVLGALGLAMTAFAGDTGPISPNADDIEFVAGNPRCPSGQYASIKVDPGANGIFKDGAGNNVVEIYNYDGNTFSWRLVHPGLHLYDIDTVIVKGGPNANVYTYGQTTDDGDTGLHAPVNPNGNTSPTRYYGISHIQFCFDQKPV